MNLTAVDCATLNYVEDGREPKVDFLVICSSVPPLNFSRLCLFLNADHERGDRPNKLTGARSCQFG